MAVAYKVSGIFESYPEITHLYRLKERNNLMDAFCQEKVEGVYVRPGKLLVRWGDNVALSQSFVHARGRLADAC